MKRKIRKGNGNSESYKKVLYFMFLDKNILAIEGFSMVGMFFLSIFAKMK